LICLKKEYSYSPNNQLIYVVVKSKIQKNLFGGGIVVDTVSVVPPPSNSVTQVVPTCDYKFCIPELNSSQVLASYW
jgi:hypothetical protein